MIDITQGQCETVAGGNVFSDAISIGAAVMNGARGYFTGLSAIGGTLSNYYGTEMTLQIVAAGNMTA